MASTNFEKNDYLIEKATNILFFVVKKDINNMILRREKDDELQEYPIHFINSFFEGVDLETAKILYEEENKEVPIKDREQSKPVNMAAKRLKNAARALKGELK